MGNWQNSSFKNRETLVSLKEKLKDRVTDPQLNWEDRMNLYRQIQMIKKQLDDCLEKAQ